jgi:coenzyme PQQ precursor peptide PqqA
LAGRDRTSLRAVVFRIVQQSNRRRPMVWTTPTLVEICIGLEINGYLPAEF